uniref:Uncharacterized protein n=1 Tax=Helianthus annuus TaxID=4232 RepID=A0A251SES1_HELAN
MKVLKNPSTRGPALKFVEPNFGRPTFVQNSNSRSSPLPHTSSLFISHQSLPFLLSSS